MSVMSVSGKTRIITSGLGGCQEVKEFISLWVYPLTLAPGGARPTGSMREKP
jgi:hypothetical protein